MSIRLTVLFGVVLCFCAESYPTFFLLAVYLPPSTHPLPHAPFSLFSLSLHHCGVLQTQNLISPLLKIQSCQWFFVLILDFVRI